MTSVIQPTVMQNIQERKARANKQLESGLTGPLDENDLTQILNYLINLFKNYTIPWRCLPENWNQLQKHRWEL